MALSHWIWLGTAAYAWHILEEYEFNWRDWARNALGLPVEWSDFYIANAIVIALGICSANLANAAPGIALSFIALMLINAIFFHIAPFIKMRGRFSPGLITAVLLFLPIGALAYRAAFRSGALTTTNLLVSIALGAALMASPILLLKLKGKPYFQQNRT